MKSKQVKKQPEQERFINRDISWLEFNSRVLSEAMDPGNPRLEQLKFISIFSSNLDEFFMVRIAGICRQEPDVPQKIYGKYTYLPGKLLAELTGRIRDLVGSQYRYLCETLLPALREHGIRLETWNELSASARIQSREILQKDILPVLTPIAIDPSHPFPLVPNLGLELLIRLRHEGKERFAVMEVPSVIPRFVRLDAAPGESLFIAAEDLIANHLESIFNGCEILECAPFRITRDMDLSIEEESIDDLLSEMQIALQKTGKRCVVRLEVSSHMSEISRSWLAEKLEVRTDQIYSIPGPLNLKAMFQIVSISGYPALVDSPMPPCLSPYCPEHKSMFDNIRENAPFITHLPYESFDPVVRLIEEAAEDPQVLAIKQTLYRVSGNSPVVNALIKAARNGKQVSVLFEIKARFDEQNNIRRARELAEAGAHVVYGIAGLKVHCKALLIIRREETGIHRYVHLSTGNYNDKTARQYVDIGYFTDNPLIAEDVAGLFNVITGLSDPPKWNKLLVAPFSMKDKLIYMIDREASLASVRNPGHIIMKVNSIIDYEVIEHLYQAAEKNVRIELIVRGICGVNPYALSAKGCANFRIVGILDRFLEHSRIYYFANNGVPEYFMGSADVMPRNLRRRIELLFPVDSPAIREELDFILQTSLNDRRKGRLMLGPNQFSATDKMERYESTRSQYVLYRHCRERATRHKSAASKKGHLTVYRSPEGN